jgi:CheY-like chemotaxis protein/HPt (histidine-containing phosphotransfer) domain-containing protein
VTTKAATDGPPSIAEKARSKVPRVLLVEDHQINRELISRQLSHLGCEVEIAEDGMQACVAVLKTRFDLVFMDCQMPRVDGFQAARSIREHERSHQLRRVPIVAVSASFLPPERERGIAAGMDEFVMKPAPLSQLRAILERYVGAADESGPIAKQAEQAPVTTQMYARPSAQVPDESVLDLAALSNLRAVRRPGRPNLVLDLTTGYLESSPARIEQLLTEMRGGNPSKGEIAHGLKSISATLGAVELAQTLGRIESAQRSGARAQVTSELQPLRTQYARACAALERILIAERQIEEGPA